MASDDITGLIAPLKTENPRLYQALLELQQRLGLVEDDLFPLVRQATTTAVIEAALTAPGSFVFSFTSTTVRFNWTSVDGAAQYEIRKGEVWETAALQLRSSSLQADVDALPVGTHTYLIKSITSGGTYSAAATSCVVTVPAIGAPAVSAQVIDNNVLLTWTTPATSFAIDHFILRRGGSEIAQVRGNFTVWFEMIGGTYEYTVAAVDVAGNEGAQGSVGATLTTPSDFVLQATRVSTLGGFATGAPHFVYLSELALFGDVNYRYHVQAGFEAEVTDFYYAELVVSFTISDMIREAAGPSLLGPWVATDWEHHFTNNVWLDPQNQVDAGYPLYLQPAGTTGYYEEIYDYGAIFSNNIVTVTWGQELLTVFSVGVVVKMSVSDDGISYTPYVSGASQFYPSLRFLKLKVEFTGENDKALIRLSNLTISLSVKKELDSGNLIADASDVGGTEVFFNKAFKDVESITLTVGAQEPVVAIYDFVDVPNPVSFKVFALDSSGNRITYPVSWKARGIA